MAYFKYWGKCNNLLRIVAGKKANTRKRIILNKMERSDYFPFIPVPKEAVQLVIIFSIAEGLTEA